MTVWQWLMLMLWGPVGYGIGCWLWDRVRRRRLPCGHRVPRSADLLHACPAGVVEEGDWTEPYRTMATDVANAPVSERSFLTVTHDP